MDFSLTYSVPDLELDGLSIQLDCSDFEINTNGGDVGFGVSVVCESEEQTRFTDTGVSNKEQFEQIIAVFSINNVGTKDTTLENMSLTILGEKEQHIIQTARYPSIRK